MRDHDQSTRTQRIKRSGGCDDVIEIREQNPPYESAEASLEQPSDTKHSALAGWFLIDIEIVYFIVRHFVVLSY